MRTMFLVFPVMCICALSVCTSCTSCAVDSAGVSVWGGDIVSPKMLTLVTVSGNELSASFSAPISVSHAVVNLGGSPDLPVSLSWHAGTGENTISFVMEKPVGIGESASLSATVADAHGNTLSFSVPFTGFNNRLPVLRINEIRTEYSKPKVEYIELYAVRGGNLGGVEIQNAMNAIRPSYEFPPAEVAAGDYIVYHLRSVEEGLIDETGAVDESAGIDSRPFARDFWDNLTSAPLKKTNVILLRERRGGPIMDALLIAEADKTAWPNDEIRVLAEEAVSSGAWMPGSLPGDAVCSTGVSPTRTLGRNEISTDTDTKEDWKICGTSKCSPGATNALP